MCSIILASASPRRKEILEKHGINTIIIRPEVDETIRSGFSHTLTVPQTVMFLALKKGLSVYSQLHSEIRMEGGLLISADTVVYDGRIIGKPENEKDAFDILDSLKNKRHQVLTGVAVTDLVSGSSQILYDVSNVYFKNYSDETIENYIQKEQPFDKAGAYAIQSSWGEQVEKIEGDMENIIGLPYHLIVPMLHDKMD